MMSMEEEIVWAQAVDRLLDDLTPPPTLWQRLKVWWWGTAR